jgi:tyrosyl-tRNA synthetase
VLANARTYLEQFHRIVPREGTRVVYQAEWYERFGLKDVFRLASRFTVQQMLAREEFRKRQSAGTPIPIKDLLYPLLQAQDSVEVEADVEFGGTDQKFNILAGRELQEMVGHRPQQVFLVQMLEGTDGLVMSKTKRQTAIWLLDPPAEQFGKIMSIPDEVMPHYFEWGTEMPTAEVRSTIDALARKELSPRDAKELLARRIVSELHSAAAAVEAATAWTRQFRDRQAPVAATSATLEFETPEVSIVDVLVALKRARNKAEARNAVSAGGVTVDGSPATLETKLARGARVLIQVSRHAFDVQIAP